VALTHATRPADDCRRAGCTVDRVGRRVTHLGEYFQVRLGRAIGELTTLQRLAPGVDIDAFSPKVSGAEVRASLGLTDRPVVVCVSRLVPRKGQDLLIRAMPAIRAGSRRPAARQRRPYRSTLEGLAKENGMLDHVVFTGSLPWRDLPAHYAAGDVFAMPCRTRLGGLDVEGLGIVYLEASATGLPVVAGDSGGAPDAVLDGRTVRRCRARRRRDRGPDRHAADRPGARKRPASAAGPGSRTSGNGAPRPTGSRHC
jgi:phosphatidylinositol alpha-1,6-mannosyltransferase